MDAIERKVKQSLKEQLIKERPNASCGLWVAPLLPTAIILSAIKHPYETLSVYKSSAVLSVGLLLTAVVFIIQCARKKDISKSKDLLLLPGSATATIFYIYFEQGFIFSGTSGLVAGIGYYKFFLFIMKACPMSFTVGEASLVAQAGVLFLFSSALNIARTIGTTPTKVLDISTLIIQIGLLSIGLLTLLIYKYPKLRKPLPFYTTLTLIMSFCLFLPLHVILKRSPVLWIIFLLTRNIKTIKFLVYCSILALFAALAVQKQIVGAKKASTVMRKTFHLLAVAVYIPGLLYECSILYLASGVMFGIFIMLEILRILTMPPLGQRLQDGFIVFCDEKDAGPIALTPIYLLIGCSMPIWIHPAPCDLTDSIGNYVVPLISGLLSIGVGDTAASAIGSNFGRHKWPGSKKTVEGTLACVFSQALFIFAFIHFGYITRGHMQIIKSAIGIIIISLVEARTSQIDNLVLPLFMYIVLIL